MPGAPGRAQGLPLSHIAIPDHLTPSCTGGGAAIAHMHRTTAQQFKKEALAALNETDEKVKAAVGPYSPSPTSTRS